MKGNLFNTMRLVIYIWALETYFLYGNIRHYEFKGSIGSMGFLKNKKYVLTTIICI